MYSIITVLSLFIITVTVSVLALPMKRTNDEYAQRVIEQYEKLTNNGTYDTDYFSKDNYLPFYSIETLIVEEDNSFSRLDYGHLSTSETLSYWIWLEAVNGKITGNYEGVDWAWSVMEKFLIPYSEYQRGNNRYNSNEPSIYVPEYDGIQNYPIPLTFQTGIAGMDPIAKELQVTYGTWDMYSLHWLVDGDNWYGYGQQENGYTRPVLINTFRRGPSESVWQTIPHPSFDEFRWGGSNGFLDLFFIDNNFYYPKQYKYTTCPDADARAIQATYFAYLWAKEDGINLPYSIILRATRLGDYLRYSHYDKYFKKIGDCFNYKLCTPGSGKNSAHYLISWAYSWGGGIMGDWTWRRGSSYIHSGYQNPLVAWIFSTQSAFKLKSSTGNKDWSVSLDRQLEFMRWLQTPEGCIAGGATNSWEGQYNTPPQNITNFYGMYYDWQPVYHNPSSNNWIGMQARSIERVCSLYYLSGNQKAELICQTWVEWIKKNIQIHDYEIIHATKLTWEGNPDDWDSSSFYKSGINTSLHGTVFEMGFDLGSMASIVKSLLWVSMKDNDQEGLDLAIQIMDIIENYKDDLGYAVEEFHDNYSKFANPVYFPNDWKGRNPQGAYLKRGACFLDIRPKYKEDPDWYQVEYYLNGYENPPVFTYHRFWVQAEIMIANGLLSIYKVKSSNHNDHSNNNNNNNNNNNSGSGSGITRTNCSEAIIQEGYECCPIGCKIYYTDSSGDWGIYNNDWCGCGSYVEPYCNQEAILYGYPCCSECSTVYYQDKNGEWGIENGDWCGMPYKCKNK